MQDLLPVKLIALGGFIGTGKSTLARLVQDQLTAADPSSYVFVAPFAASLKALCTEEFGWNGAKDEKGRALLQNVGSAGRSYNPDIWGDLWQKHLKKDIAHFSTFQSPKQLIFIVDDCRYENETQRIQKLGGHVVFLSAWWASPGAHESEQYNPNWADSSLVLEKDRPEPAVSSLVDLIQNLKPIGALP